MEQYADIFHPGNIALLPLRTRTRGPAYALPALPSGTDLSNIDPDSESYDALDEVLSLFRANTFFRNFEIKGPADRLLIYGILFVSECLTKIKSTMSSKDAEKVCEDLIAGWNDPNKRLRLCLALHSIQILPYRVMLAFR